MEHEFAAVDLPPPWDLVMIETAIDQFWDSFFVERPLLLSYAESHMLNFPEEYMFRFIHRLNRVDWKRQNDPDYSVPIKVMKRLASKPWVENGDEYICSIFDLEKRIKRQAEKDHKKLCAQKNHSPPWDLVLIETAIDRFWVSFFIEKPFLRSFAEFAESQMLNFPEKYISRLKQRLNRADWKREKDVDYSVPIKIMKRLANNMAKPLDFEEDSLHLIIALERKIEADAKKKEAEKRRSERESKKTYQKVEAGKASRDEKKAEKEARKKVAKDTKKMAKEKNQLNRIGARSLGLL